MLATASSNLLDAAPASPTRKRTASAPDGPGTAAILPSADQTRPACHPERSEGSLCHKPPPPPRRMALQRPAVSCLLLIKHAYACHPERSEGSLFHRCTLPTRYHLRSVCPRYSPHPAHNGMVAPIRRQPAHGRQPASAPQLGSRSRHSGFTLSISAIFLARSQRLSCFSRRIASSTRPNSSA